MKDILDIQDRLTELEDLEDDIDDFSEELFDTESELGELPENMCEDRTFLEEEKIRLEKKLKELRDEANYLEEEYGMFYAMFSKYFDLELKNCSSLLSEDELEEAIKGDIPSKYNDALNDGYFDIEQYVEDQKSNYTIYEDSTGTYWYAY